MPPAQTFWEVLESRASCRDFSHEPVTTDEITTILRAAKSAPSAGNLEAWRTFVLDGPKLQSRIATAAFGQEWIRSAGAVLVFCAETQLSSTKYGKRGKRLYSVQDATIACSYAQLACEALNLGACWVGAFDEKAIADILETTPWPQYRPVALLVIGKMSKTKPRRSPRLALSELVKTEDWKHDPFPRGPIRVQK